MLVSIELNSGGKSNMSRKNQITGCKAAVDSIRYQSMLQQQRGSAFRKYGRRRKVPLSGSIRGTGLPSGSMEGVGRLRYQGVWQGAEGSDIGETWQQQERVSSLQVHIAVVDRVRNM
jgi:hypothetical protein